MGKILDGVWIVFVTPFLCVMLSPLIITGLYPITAKTHPVNFSPWKRHR